MIRRQRILGEFKEKHTLDSCSEVKGENQRDEIREVIGLHCVEPYKPLVLLTVRQESIG